MRRGIIRTRTTAAVMAIALGAGTLAACTPAPELTPQQRINEIIGFVEAVRGHQFVTPPTVAFLSDSAFRQEVLDNVAAAEPSVNKAETTFKALGWMSPGDNLYNKFRIAFGGAVVGFYDPVTKALKVRGTDLTPYRREVIAHELTHALDDQLFALDDDFADGLLGEKTFSALVAIEGDAVRTQNAYRSSMTGIEQAQDIAEQLAAGADPALLTVPLALLTFTQAPYLRGASFLDDIVGTGGIAGIDALFARYPSTAEQAFNSTKYIANEPAVAVTAPSVPGTIVEQGSFGVFLMTLLLRDGLALDTVDIDTDGWAGDSYVSYTMGGQSCIAIVTQMDTAPKLATLTARLNVWASTHSGTTVSSPAATSVRIDRCV